MKTNLLEITNSFGLGGTEKTMQIYCKYLNKKLFNVYVCAFSRSGPRESSLRKNSIDLLVAGKEENKIIKFIKEKKISIVHWHNIPKSKDTKKIEIVLEYCKKNDIKIIETSPFSNFNNSIDKLLDKRIFVSRANIAKFQYKFKIFDKNKYFYLYNPLDIDELKKFILSKEKISKIKRKYGIRKDDFVIGKVGRADIWKWSDEIINIVPSLIKEIPNLKVVIRALPKEKLSKLSKMKIEKYFILLPETSSERELSETYQIMDIMVHTSRIGECNSVAINEAMFYGIPIITTSTDFMQPTLYDRDNGQVELIVNGKNGFIVKEENEMIKKIYKMYSNRNLIQFIKKNNRQKANTIFAVKNIINDFRKIITEKNSRTSDRNDDYLREYKLSRIKQSKIELFKLNMNAIFDYFKIYLNV